VRNLTATEIRERLSGKFTNDGKPFTKGQMAAINAQARRADAIKTIAKHIAAGLSPPTRSWFSLGGDR